MDYLITSIPLHAIDHHPLFHLRQHGSLHEEGGLAPLVASLQGPEGLIHPIVVAPTAVTTTFGRRYTLIAGHRRLAAAQQLDWATIPARVLPPCDLTMSAIRLQLLSIALRENVERQELHPEDRRRTLRQLKALYEEVYPASRPLLSTTPVPPRFTRWAATITHISAQTIRRDLRVGALTEGPALARSSTDERTMPWCQAIPLASQLLIRLETVMPHDQPGSLPQGDFSSQWHIFQRLHATLTRLLACYPTSNEEAHHDTPA